MQGRGVGRCGEGVWGMCGMGVDCVTNGCEVLVTSGGWVVREGMWRRSGLCVGKVCF